MQSLIQSVSTEITAGTPYINTDGEEDDDYDFGMSASMRPLDDSGRKGSVVTATTTISQTYEGARTPASLARAVSAGEGDDGDRAEALDALGDPPLARALLLLAEMSSEGNLMDAGYTKKCVEAARENQDFVVGFISQRTLNESNKDNFLSFTPGVSLTSPEGVGDGLGQQYRTPAKVIVEDGCDIVIVGRGIIGAKDRAKEAERYMSAAWKAYEARIGN